MIRVVGVSKQYRIGGWGRKVEALTDLNLHVRQGEIFGYLGPNGAGKSTTIKILMDFIRPSRGKATICGQNVGNPEARSNVGFLPENPNFYGDLTADELLWFGGKTAGMSATHIKDRSIGLLSQVGLADARNRRLKTYSKGMIQRLGLAFALIHDPQVVILDEPMSGLDPLGRKMVGDLILLLKCQGKTVFFSSHILSDVERLCDRVGIIVDGVLRRVDSLDMLLADVSSLDEMFFQEVEKARL